MVSLAISTVLMCVLCYMLIFHFSFSVFSVCMHAIKKSCCDMCLTELYILCLFFFFLFYFFIYIPTFVTMINRLYIYQLNILTYTCIIDICNLYFYFYFYLIIMMINFVYVIIQYYLWSIALPCIFFLFYYLFYNFNHFDIIFILFMLYIRCGMCHQ
jgi:hypothetical protein